MFENIEASRAVDNWSRPLALLVSTAAHGIAIGVLVVLPLLLLNVLPESQLLTFLIAPPPTPPLAHPYDVQTSGERAARPRKVKIVLETGFAPGRIPDRIPPAPHEDVFRSLLSLQWSTRGISDAIQGSPSGSGTGIGPAIGPPVALPPPPKPAARREPIRRGGEVLAARLVRKVEPDYPSLAKLARVQGPVILQVTVDEEGNVADVRVLSGHPLLREETVRAVQQWKYSPTFLNGEPVPVTATVTVIFNLR